MDPNPVTASSRFEVLFRTHYRDVHRFALRRIEPSAAEELVNETFAVCWTKLDEVPEPPLPWLYEVARRCLANRRRTATRHEQTAARARADPEHSGRDPAERFAEQDTILRAFTALAETDRDTLRLVAWDGLSLADGARAAGVSRPAFAMRVHRARRRLARHLETLENPDNLARKSLETAHDPT